MWKRLKNRKTETPEPEEILNSPAENENDIQNTVIENENEDHETIEMAESDSENPLDAEEVSGEGIEKLIDTLKEAIDGDDAQQQPLKLLLDFVTTLAEGTIDKETLLTLQKGCSYDADIEKARAEGEIVGRNAVIIEEFESRENEEKEDVPDLTGSFESPYTGGSSIFDLARNARM